MSFSICSTVNSVGGLRSSALSTLKKPLPFCAAASASNLAFFAALVAAAVAFRLPSAVGTSDVVEEEVEGSSREMKAAVGREGGGSGREMLPSRRFSRASSHAVRWRASQSQVVVLGK